MVLFFFFFFLLTANANDIVTLHKMLNETTCKAMIDKTQLSLQVVKIGLETTWQAEDQMLFEAFSKGILDLKARYYELNVTHDSGYQLFSMNEENTTSPVLYASSIGQVTSVLFLNDNVAGGEWVFPRQGNFTVAPECGKMVLFPSSYTHPHTIKRIRLGRELFVVSFFF